MFDFGSWQTWIVIVALVLGVVAGLFLFRHQPQSDSVWQQMRESPKEITVLVWAASERAAIEQLRGEYPEKEWEIIKYTYDAKSKVWIFILRQRSVGK